MTHCFALCAQRPAATGMSTSHSGSRGVPFVLTETLMQRDFDPSTPLCRITQAVEDMQSLHELYESAFLIGGFAPWEQLGHDLLFFPPVWCRLFGLEKPPVLLEEYLELIDDAAERERVRTARPTFRSLPPDKHWSDTFTLAGRPVRSTCLAAKSGRLIGVDSLVTEK